MRTMNNITFQDIFLRVIFEKLKKEKTSSEVFDQIVTSPIFNDSDKIYLKRIFERFWEGDNLSVSSLSIPVIESAIRNLFILNKSSYIKENKDGGYDVRSLNELLEDQLIKTVFSSLGENVSFYLKVLLVNRLGWNLRNNYAHGMNKMVFFEENVANRMIHVILLLSLIRNK